MDYYQKRAFIAGRRCGKSAINELVKIWEETVMSKLTVDDWIKHDITEEQADLYPAAKKVRDFKNSKLYKAMK